MDSGTIREFNAERYGFLVADVDPQTAASAARIVADNLRVDAVTAEVLRAFAAEGVESRLLKGAATARWLYSSVDPRSYTDCDLLIRPADVRAAGAVLERLGFAPELDEERMPQWWREHAVGWVRADDPIAVDIHRTLPGVGADHDRVWELLSAGDDRVAVGGFDAAALGLPGRALHVALHAAQHGPEWGGAVGADLARALEQAGDETWAAASELAARLDAIPAFATGLRLQADGAALADRLGLPHTLPADVALRVGGAPPVALGLEQLAQASGLLSKLGLLARKAFPPPTFIRHWHPPAARSRRALLLGYLRRPLWLLGHAPAGLRAWLHARRGS